MAGLVHYYSRYDREHKLPANKLLHGIGIPVIISGLALAALAFWRVGLALFAGGWALLFLGHRLEGNHPAFFQGPIYFLVGPLWVARELRHWLLSRQPFLQPRRRSRPATERPPDLPLPGYRAAGPSLTADSVTSPSELQRMGRRIKHWLFSPPARSARR